MFGVQPFLAESIKKPHSGSTIYSLAGRRANNAMYTKTNHHFQQLFDQKSDRNWIRS